MGDWFNVTIVISEGIIPESEYTPIRTQGEEWRSLINQYEAQLPEAKAEWDNRVIEQDEIEEPFVETVPDLFQPEEVVEENV